MFRQWQPNAVASKKGPQMKSEPEVSFNQCKKCLGELFCSFRWDLASLWVGACGNWAGLPMLRWCVLFWTIWKIMDQSVSYQYQHIRSLYNILYYCYRDFCLFLQVCSGSMHSRGSCPGEDELNSLVSTVSRVSPTIWLVGLETYHRTRCTQRVLFLYSSKLTLGKVPGA